jgi:hypothetical protein
VQAPLLHLQQVWKTDAVERDEKQLSLRGTTGFDFTIHPHEIVSVLLLGTGEPQPPANDK